MARTKIKIPNNAKPLYSHLFTISINDINYGGHMGNERILILSQELRIKYLNEIRQSEISFFPEEDIPSGLILTEAVINYHQEVFWGESLLAKLYLGEVTPSHFELYSLFFKQSPSSQNAVCTCKVNLSLYDYNLRKILKINPEKLTHQLQSLSPSQ